MTHAEFVAKRQAGLVSMGISQTDALCVVKYLPTTYRVAINIVWFLTLMSIPGCIVVVVLYSWWGGLLGLVILLPLGFAFSKELASQYVLQHAEEDPRFFEFLNDAGALCFRETNQ